MRHNCITSTSYVLLSNATCFGGVPYRTFKICFAVLLHFIVIPVCCFGTVFHQSWFYSMLHALGVSVLIWACYSGQLKQAKCCSKSLICKEYYVRVETVYSHGIFWIFMWLLYVLCVTVSVVTMNMSNFRNTQLTGIWTANCFDSSSPYSKILYKVWHLSHFPSLVLSSSLYENFSWLGINVMAEIT